MSLRGTTDEVKSSTCCFPASATTDSHQRPGTERGPAIGHRDLSNWRSMEVSDGPSQRRRRCGEGGDAQPSTGGDGEPTQDDKGESHRSPFNDRKRAGRVNRESRWT
mgnify:CR=1 FL=1